MSTVLTEGRGRVASMGSFVVMWPQSQLHCVSLMDVSGKEAGVVLLKKMFVLRLDLDLSLQSSHGLSPGPDLEPTVTPRSC